MQKTVILFQALSAGGAVPEWIQLVPAGTFYGVDGRGPYVLSDPAAVIAASMQAGKLPLDENHAIDTAAPAGRPSPARGWIVAMEARPDGLWGRVEWTESGRALIADRAYRGISPAFIAAGDTGQVMRMLRASLTNDPNLNLATLHQRGIESMEFLKKLRAALGLAADATEDAVLAAATTSKTAIDTHAASLARLATAAGVKDDAAKAITVDGLVTHLTAHAQARDAAISKIAAAAGLAGDAAKGATAESLVLHLQARTAALDGDKGELIQKVVGLEAQLNAVQSERARDVAERVIDKAIADGKPIRNMRDHYIARHMKDAVSVVKELAGMPSLNDGSLRHHRDNDGDPAGLSGSDLETCELMGLDQTKYAATLKAEKTKVLA